MFEVWGVAIGFFFSLFCLNITSVGLGGGWSHQNNVSILKKNGLVLEQHPR